MMAIPRQPGDEAVLLRTALDRLTGMLKPYGLVADYTIDVSDNSYTTSVRAEGLGFDETWTRLRRYKDLEAILREIVFAPDEERRVLAIQRAGCMLDGLLPHAVE